MSGRWINIRAPGHSSADHSLGIRIEPGAPEGFIINSFAGDDPVICRKYVRERLRELDAGGALSIEQEFPQGSEAAQQARINAALTLWNEAVPAQGTIVEKYLAARGCPLTAAVTLADHLRFHPFCPFGAARVPAMVALMTDTTTRKPKGVHRTALQNDGSGKRVMPDGMPSKRMLGVAKGAAVMLRHRAPQIGIAEGIETALSAQAIFAMPVWACLSAQGIAGFPIIKGLDHLTIFADHDDAGLRAAFKCGSRYRKAGIEAEVRFPPKVDADWNDHLVEEHE